jgi:thymidylate kinase
MHVVLLGPDGVGKTAVQEAILRSSRTGFSEVHGRSFAPAPWRRPRRSLGKPHALPGRSLPTSLLKAAWWFYYYTVGYYFTVYPAVSRSALYLNHRYIVDSLVDARRYRYRGPRWILRLICWAAPRPDLVVLLDAPPEVVQARKQEVPLEETARACAAYRDLVRALPNGRIIDATPPVEQVVAEVVRTIQQLRIARTARRFGLE